MTQTQQKRKHIPTRTCVVCREKAEKRSLTRVTYTEETGLQIDTSGKARGRGAYLCQKPTCWQRAQNSNILDHALRVSLSAVDKQQTLQWQT
jgi:predicted RNA-binding protein YlxR (DUF448 family)